MSNPETTTIEINGVKLEVDLRNAKRIDTMKVGTRVKVLKKEYNTDKVYHGVIIGFEPFKRLPTIIVACALIEYSSAKIEFIYYNSESKDVEIVVANDSDHAAIDKLAFEAKINLEVEKKEAEIKELKDRLAYFNDKFGCYFSNPDTELQ